MVCRGKDVSQPRPAFVRQRAQEPHEGLVAAAERTGAHVRRDLFADANLPFVKFHAADDGAVAQGLDEDGLQAGVRFRMLAFDRGLPITVLPPTR